MGTKSLMERSPTSCTIKICQLHLCLSKNLSTLTSEIESLKLYPVMDGAFITAKNKTLLTHYLKSVFESMATDFIQEGSKDNHLYQSILRACIAYGPLGHGSDINTDEIPPNYKNSLLFGLPMSQAYSSEQEAPPFGIFIDKSARAFSPSTNKPFSTRWFIWFEKNYSQKKKLQEEVTKYFKWAKEKMSLCLPYDEEKIEKHEKACIQYLNYYESNPKSDISEEN